MPFLPAADAPPPTLVAAKLDARMATASKLVAEWYPRINVLLFDPGHPLPVPKPAIRIEAELKFPDAPAYADDDTLHLRAGYIQDQDDADFEGMVIHEITHIDQHTNQYDNDSAWVVEGIADYVRHKYFAKDIEARLRMRPDGHLQGYAPQDIYLYGLQQQDANLAVQGYQARYTVASAFLYWLELRKDSRIVHELSVALERNRFTPALFAQTCGAPLDALWGEFVAESEQGGGAPLK